MRVLVAGGTGVIGRRLVPRLLEHGYDVVATTRHQERAASLQDLGAAAEVLDAIDLGKLEGLARRYRPGIIVQQLTALTSAGPPTADHHARTAFFRSEATAALIRGAPHARVVAQSVAFLARPEGESVLDENAALFLDAPGSLAVVARGVEAMERIVQRAGGVSLRYGFLYGPGSAYHHTGRGGRAILAGRLPIIGSGEGRWSWIHVDDAVTATLTALENADGIFNICDDEPARLRDWLPHVANAIGAPDPPHLRRSKSTMGPEYDYYAIALPGASNARARAELGWTPSHPTWRAGLALGLREDLQPVLAAEQDLRRVGGPIGEPKAATSTDGTGPW